MPLQPLEVPRYRETSVQAQQIVNKRHLNI